jgi:hypothetical protein
VEGDDEVAEDAEEEVGNIIRDWEILCVVSVFQQRGQRTRAKSVHPLKIIR